MSKSQIELAAMLARDYHPRKAYVLQHGSHCTQDAVRDAAKIMRLCRTIRRWAELECNGINRWDANYYGPGKGGVGASWTEEDQTKADKLTERAQAALVEILANYSLAKLSDDINGKPRKIKFQGDPRGWLVSFRCKNANTSWGY